MPKIALFRLRVSLMVVLLAGEASGFFVSPIRQLANHARQRFDESLYFAIAPSPFALSESFETSAFQPSRAQEAETTVTMVWPTEQQQRVESNLVHTTTSALGELAGFTVVSAMKTDRGFMLVAKGSRVALRHFMQQATMGNLVAQKIEWGA
jgi:hypothetical protein